MRFYYIICDMSVKILAPAKVNIGLHVFKKNEDREYEGFHKIEGIFQTVKLFDELEVDFLYDGEGSEKFSDCFGKCVVICDSMALPESNTLTKTFDAFSEITGLNRSVRVSLIKNIPSGGGLGGGSSDGAFFLKALSELHSIELTSELAFSVASKVGSDVFFFLGLENGFGSAVVTGRGEKVFEIEARKLHFLLVFPDVFSSTKEAYGLLDDFYAEYGSNCDYLNFSEYDTLYRRDISDWCGNGSFCGFKNSFTDVLATEYPLISAALFDLKESGCVFCDMSGSGSTVFGIFEDEAEAQLAYSRLSPKWKCVLA